MENDMTRTIKPIWITFSLLVLALSACGGDIVTPDTAAVDAIYTQAAGTVGAKLTQTAMVSTNTPVPSPTLADSPTLGPTQTPLITNTPEITSTPILIATQPQTAITGACDDMVYVSDVTVTDGSQVVPGSKFVKTWKIRNTGKCNWSTNYRLIYGWSSDTWKDIKLAPPASVLLTKAVAPGEEYEISVTLTAPVTSGNYSASFRLQNEQGYNVGTTLQSILILLFQVNGTPTP
jgi:hypothetical protein